jgi:hypothetical protein
MKKISLAQFMELTGHQESRFGLAGHGFSTFYRPKSGSLAQRRGPAAQEYAEASDSGSICAGDFVSSISK